MNDTARCATVFGLGRAPYAPGTAASFAALIVAIPVMVLLGWIAMLVLAAAAAAFGVWVSGRYALDTGVADPKECVIDEVAGQWLACAFAPVSFWGFLFAFLLFRLFDIAKPWPVSKAETLAGGLGIVADDVVAGLMAGVVVFLFDWGGFL
jgi:phosphatidylglycerophosphatase A